LRAQRSRKPPSASIRAVCRLRLLGHDGGPVCGFRQSPTSWSMQRAATGRATQSLPMPRSQPPPHAAQARRPRGHQCAPRSFRHCVKLLEPGRVPRQSDTDVLPQQLFLLNSIAISYAACGIAISMPPEKLSRIASRPPALHLASASCGMNIVNYFTAPKTLRRIHVGSLGPYVDSFVNWSQEHIIHRSRVQGFVRAVADWSRWLHVHDVGANVMTAGARIS
jgi:hypothetical protein